MKIVSSILPPENLREEVQKEFLQADFKFFRGIKSAGESLYDAEILITYGEDLTEDHIHKSKRLKWNTVMSAGMDEMPFKACKQKGILLRNEPLPKGHPFWKMENVTVMPQLSSVTKIPRSFEIFKHNLHTYIKNNKDYINVIDLERGY
ncbi:hypothetical protein J7I93_11720 [Bacillus sp. ISL-47]|uniref:hypothetical protein n=1 Tax=Bacillus sp. ISL-47 TaxID=2819130 RepID=UPI001BE7377E|nr:hypothetical protein [Bacillus sp. ISL-47]MBT2688852.1 hypothetical protein [Bacillus sp. ISL-47]MBT2710765.1 hypothetical protein [Pseudomonas sp. ISL-84]